MMAKLIVALQKGWTPLHVAADQGHVGITSFLLNAGANAHALTREVGLPPKLDAPPLRLQPLLFSCAGC
jgi:ankyrin repeat protein